MKILEPDYASSFRCLAGACPDTCCKDWEIILDEDTLARYQELPGAFGDEVRAALTQDADGDTMFRLTDGHCPLLREDGLCRVQLALGEEGLCNTCRQHPRFYEEYGSTKELTLSISCPAAAKLLLEHDASVTFVSHEDGAPVSGCNDLDPDRYFALRRFVNKVFCFLGCYLYATFVCVKYLFYLFVDIFYDTVIHTPKLLYCVCSAVMCIKLAH